MEGRHCTMVPAPTLPKPTPIAEKAPKWSQASPPLQKPFHSTVFGMSVHTSRQEMAGTLCRFPYMRPSNWEAFLSHATGAVCTV